MANSGSIVGIVISTYCVIFLCVYVIGVERIYDKKGVLNNNNNNNRHKKRTLPLLNITHNNSIGTR